MTFRRLLLTLVLVVAACTSESAGGEVTVEETTTTSPAPVTTTTAPTTTTTLPTFHVSGRVSSEDGSPLARAFVTMGEVLVVTGPDGWFSFETTTPSSMVISKPGWSSTDLAWDEATTFYRATVSPETIRGLRIAAEAAASDAAFDALLRLADESAVNAFVFDTKRESGEVLYDTAVGEAHEIGAVEVMYDPVDRIARAREHGLYIITRIAAFEDDVRAAAVPDEKLAGTWLDPSSESAQDYVLALAVEACELGFDEIQFDYVRYPAGRTAEVSGQRDLSQDHRLEVVAGFLARARETLHPMGCAVSAAVFGIVVSVPDDQGLGQRPEEVSAQVDTLSPMVYPSHYSEGWLGLGDPNDHPYDVTADAIGDAVPRLADGTILRPYLQAFWWSNSQIRMAIQAAEDAGVGWILWNVLSNYHSEAIPTDAEVNGP